MFKNIYKNMGYIIKVTTKTPQAQSVEALWLKNKIRIVDKTE